MSGSEAVLSRNRAAQFVSWHPAHTTWDPQTETRTPAYKRGKYRGSTQQHWLVDHRRNHQRTRKGQVDTMSQVTAAYEILPSYVQDSDEWHEARTHGLGASEVSAILGLSTWQTPLSVYNTKNGRPHHIDPNLHYFGHALEPVTAKWVQDKHPEIGTVLSGFSARSKRWPWLTASPDRVVMVRKGREGYDAPLELKTVLAYQRDKWANGVPENYVAQVMTQILVMDAPFGYLAVLHGGAEAELHKVKRDEALIERIIRETRAFWEVHVLAGIPPLPSNSSEAVDLWPGDPAAGAAEATADDYEAFLELGDRLRTVAEENERIEELKLRLQVAMKDAPLLVHGDVPLATWKPRKGSTRFDTTAFKREYPDLAQEYTRTGEPTRVFKPLVKETEK